MASEVTVLSGAPNHYSNDDMLYEVIDGAIVELPEMGTRQRVLTNFLLVELANQTKGIGRALMEVLFDFTEQVGRKRRPDLAFVSYDRWPNSKSIPDIDGWQVIPNLVVEVISKTNTWEEIQEKIEEYFQVGVERVWVISVARKLVQVYESPTRVNILTSKDALTGDPVMPGFRVSLQELFATVDG